MADFNHWKTWTIISKNQQGDYACHVASFHTRTLCEEYLNMKKEQCFFETGSMEEAESKWGLQNFLIDYTMVITRTSIANNFTINFGEWNNG